MNLRHLFLSLALVSAVLWTFTTAVASGFEEEISFQRQIRPILSDKCFQCHGPDAAQRQADLRLDKEKSAKTRLDSGLRAIHEGDLANSEVIARISTDDEDLMMPPPDLGKSLTEIEIQLLKKWVRQGANWEQHWAFEPIVRPKALDTESSARRSPDFAFAINNEIDQFVVRAFENRGVKQNSQATKAALIRRVSLDLTGLPPTLEMVREFETDDSENAYEKVVDRLLTSPAYGEHFGRYWLDAARYGDTHGLHLDNYREMWAYRDYVIDSFNSNKPFDEFAIEQLAGDLLEDPTDEQLIATGFNRCHVTTSEGGSIAEEVHSRNVVERVVATGTVFMGLTMDCTRCHDHKFDPLTMKDFYSLYAFFNNIDGAPLDGNKKDHAPVLKVWSPEARKRKKELDDEETKLSSQLEDYIASLNYSEPENPSPPTKAAPAEFVWMDDHIPSGAKPSGDQPWVFLKKPVFSGKTSHIGESKGFGQHLFQSASTPMMIEDGDVLFSYVFIDEESPPKEIMLQWNDGSWDHRAYWGEDKVDWGKNDSPSRLPMGPIPEVGKWVRLEVKAKDVGLKKGSKVTGWAFTQHGGKIFWDKCGKVEGESRTMLYDSFAMWKTDQAKDKGKSLSKPLRTLLEKPETQLSDDEQQALRREFFRVSYRESWQQVQSMQADIAAVGDESEALGNKQPTTLIYRERKQPKPAHVLTRGEYDQPADEVTRATPAVLPEVKTDSAVDRLALAKWLVSDEHPLTARVTVNRVWQQFFGTGLVKTSEDFGSQGEPPSHPRLLDWLASEFRSPQSPDAQHAWDVRHLVKLIVMSATYQQDPAIDPEEYQIDPDNRLLCRGPRYRLDAEMLRDQALSIGGLLVQEVGGPSVKPPQPDGLWFAVGYSGSNTVRFKADQGHDKVHRRTLYTFIKRTAPPPQMSTFDAPSRESCTVRRERTNSPLQALLLMNDPQYVECAKGLAIRAMIQANLTPRQRASFMLQQAVLREVTREEADELVSDFEFYRQDFQKDEDRASQLIAVGQQKPPEKLSPVDLAAWTMVANLILNLDEVVNK